MQSRIRSVAKTSLNHVIKVAADEKDAKLKKSQTQRWRQFLFFFLILLVAACWLGAQQQPSHIHSSGISPVALVPVDMGPSEEHLQRSVEGLDAKVRAHKGRPDVIMETDSEGLKLTKELQHVTHHLLVKRYGRHTFRVRVDLVFPDVITEKDRLPGADYLIIELAPIDLIPCSVYNFLEIARTWKSGAFHRNANHVLQVSAHSEVKSSMPFQEYSPEFPHKKGTTGYAGRPSGPGWYISIMDNSVNHGPGSQQQRNPHEADSLFGRIVHGMEDVVPRIHSTPQQGWLDKENQIQITKMTILIPEGRGETKEWVPWTSSAANGSAAFLDH